MGSSVLLPAVFDLGSLLVVEFIVLAVLLVAAGFVAIIVLITVNVRRARAAGLNPLTMQTDLTAKLLHADALAPIRTVHDRLTDLDRLLAAETITPAEHATAQASVVFVETGSTSTDRMLFSGEGTVTRGVLTGIYLFRTTAPAGTVG